MSARRIAAAAALVVCVLPLLCAQAGAQTVRVRFDTALGPFEVEIDPVRAPVTVANFLKYVDGGFYDGGRVHRSARLETQANRPVKIEVIQAGIDPARRSDAFPAIPLERTSVSGILHKDGTISMARSGPDTAVSDFFICIGDQSSLDFGGARNPDGQGFAAFGRVVSGMDIVRAIHRAPAEGENLTPPVRLFRAARLRADDAPPFDAASEIMYFGGEESGFPIPDYRLAQDPVNNFIIGTALTGTTVEDLRRRGIDDAAQRVDHVGTVLAAHAVVCDQNRADNPSSGNAVLSICMECGKMKLPSGEWRDSTCFQQERVLPLSHGYCPECAAAVQSRLGLHDRGPTDPVGETET